VAGVVVAVLDDGVDLAHPDLKGRLLQNKGRDFFVPADTPDHLDPSPKRSQFPYDQMDGNDIHGTPCAGVAVADGKAGKRVFGAAPGCRLLPIKIFHGDDLATDTRVAAAIRYAAKHARVLSCSWSGPQSPDIEFALEDIGTEHGGKGAVVCCASGNGHSPQVAFPAADPNCIAVGALTNTGVRADYSNFGPELSVVAPSGGGSKEIFTTDVSTANRGFNLGTQVPGDPQGRYTNTFSGTSSATPLVAGVCALVLSANPKLSRSEVKQVIQGTARKVGPLAYTAGRNDEYGFGCVDAAAALAHPTVGAGGKPAKKPAKKKTKPKAKKKKKAKKAKGKK
jgi:subtilisin family serine protease